MLRRRVTHHEIFLVCYGLVLTQRQLVKHPAGSHLLFSCRKRYANGIYVPTPLFTLRVLLRRTCRVAASGVYKSGNPPTQVAPQPTFIFLSLERQKCQRKAIAFPMDVILRRGYDLNPRLSQSSAP